MVHCFLTADAATAHAGHAVLATFEIALIRCHLSLLVGMQRHPSSRTAYILLHEAHCHVSGPLLPCLLWIHKK